MADKPLIVISYSHADEPERSAPGDVQWLSFVRRFLAPGERAGRFDVWVDRLMPGGEDWDPEIGRKLRICAVFILLVSTNSTASDYIISKEIAIIRSRQAKGENVHFYPLLLTPTPNAGLELVDDKNIRPRDARPFSSYTPDERLQHMKDAADEIAAIILAMKDRRSDPTSPGTSPIASDAPRRSAPSNANVALEKLTALAEEGDSFTYENFANFVSTMPATLVPKWKTWTNVVRAYVEAFDRDPDTPARQILAKALETRVLHHDESYFAQAKSFYMSALQLTKEALADGRLAQERGTGRQRETRSLFDRASAFLERYSTDRRRLVAPIVIAAPIILLGTGGVFRLLHALGVPCEPIWWLPHWGIYHC